MKKLNFSLFLSAIVCQSTPIPLSTLRLNGSAQLISSSVLRLTPNYDLPGDPPAGSAWLPNTINVAQGFSVNFQFQLTNLSGEPDPDDGSGADGFAFVIQNDPRGASTLGAGAGGLGYMYIWNSLAVEFDTYKNLPWYGDPNGNHISVHSRGPDFNVPHHRCINGLYRSSPTGYTDLPHTPCSSDPDLGSASLLPFLLTDGNLHSATISYTPGLLQISLDSSVNLLSVPVNLPSLLNLENGTHAWIGFTAGARAGFQNHDILSLDVSVVPEPAHLSWLGLLALLGLRACRSQ